MQCACINECVCVNDRLCSITTTLHTWGGPLTSDQARRDLYGINMHIVME